MVLDNFFEKLFGSGDDKERSSPTVSYKKAKVQSTRRGRGGGVDHMTSTEPDVFGTGRNLRKNPNDFELKNKQTNAGKAMDKLKNAGSLNPSDIEKLATNLQGQGATKKDLISDLIDELNKGNSIDYHSLSNTQKKELSKRLHSTRTQSHETDFEDIKTDKVIPTNPFMRKPAEQLTAEDLETIKKPAEQLTAEQLTAEDLETIKNPDEFQNNDLETTQDHHKKTDGTAIKDETLDFVHLGGTRTNFDSNFIRFVLNEFVKKSINHMTASATGIDADVVNIVTEPVVNAMPNLYDKLTGRGLNDYTRMNIDGKHQVFKTPTIPLLCITLYLYMVDKSPLFKLEINLIDSVIIKYTLSNIFKMSQSDIEYAVMIFRMIPDELRTAYNKQKGSMIGEISLNEELAIARFIDKINIDYRDKFQTSLKEDLFKYENKQSLYLYEMIETLNRPATLFEFSSAFNTMNEMIEEMIENPYMIVQLMALIYEAAEDKSILGIDSKYMSNKKIYYYGSSSQQIVKDDKVSILKDISSPLRGSVGLLVENSEKVALYKLNNRYYVAFRGTDPKSKEDIRQNVLLFGGKDLLNNVEYNKRVIEGKKYLDFAIMKSQQEGLEPPSVVGYSLGGISSMYLSTLYPNIETNVYAPILSRSKLTENIMEHLQDNNIHFNYSENDPISKNLKYYKNKYTGLNIKKYKNNKNYSSHSLNQF